VIVFAGIVGIAVVVAVGYVALATLRPRPGVAVPPSQLAAPVSPSLPTPSSASSSPSTTPSLTAKQIVFQNVDRDTGYAQVAILEGDNLSGSRTLTGLTCERVHFAAGRGMCLVPEYGLVTTYKALTFDEDFRPVHEVELAGAPTRTRVSPDGQYGAATVFVFGHSYADANFSTQTLIVDMATGESLGDLETFTTIRDGETWSSEDFNFWGVTFSPSDSNTYYATLRSAGQTYLVRGDIEKREMEVLTTNVECPSLSPDGTRVVFKKLTEGLIGQWRLHVLDLETMEETELAETRNIDDQAEWLDNETVMYGDGQNIWAVPADGGGEPQLLIANGLSPAVAR
jgi:hypothetical protein